jgi:putative ABC transport system permease protein
VLGAVLSRSLFSSVPGYLAFAFPVGQQRVVGWESVAIALATGVVAACVAVLAPLREIMSRRPLQQPAKAGRQHGSRWLAAAGVVCVLLAVGVLLLSPVAAIAGVVCLTAALLLLLPTLIHATVLAIGWIAERVDGPVPLLAVAELRARSTRARTFALAATAAVAVFAAVAVVGAYHDLQRGLDGSAHQIDRQADVWVTFPGEPNAFATTPFAISDAEISEAAELPGVASARPYRGSFLDVGDRRVWVLAPDGEVAAPIPAGQLTAGTLELADERVRAGGWVVLSDALAKELHVGVGDRVTLPTPSPTPLRVAALSTNLGWPPGAVILNARDYARAWGSPTPSGVQLDVSPDASASAVARELRELPSTAALTVETSAAREQRHYAAAREGLSRLTQIAGLVLGAAVLALASAMGGVLWQRRPKLGALKVDGLTELEIWRALLLEAALLLGAGSLAGAIFGLGGQVMLSRGLVAITGFPVTYQPAVTAAAAICGIVVAVAVAMLAVPGWLAVRVRPMPGLQV